MKNTTGLLILSSILLLAIDQDAFAQKPDKQPLQELFQTELVYTQEKGELQLTATSSFHRLAGSNMLRIPLVIEYGLTDTWQVELEWDVFTSLRRGEPGAVHGIGDARIGVKRSFMNLRHSDFHAALGLEVGVPTGDVNKDLGEGLLGYEPFFILARDFPALKRMQVFSQIGVEFVRRVRNKTDEKSEPSANEFSWNSGFFVPVGRMCFTTELNWSTKGGKDDQLYFTPGMVWELPMTWELGVGVAVGLNSRSDSSRLIIKLTHEFGSSDGASRKVTKD